MPRPLSLKEIANLPLVIPKRPNAIRMLIESKMADIGPMLQINLEIDGVSAILDLVADGVETDHDVDTEGNAGIDSGVAGEVFGKALKG